MFTYDSNKYILHLHIYLQLYANLFTILSCQIFIILYKRFLYNLQSLKFGFFNREATLLVLVSVLLSVTQYTISSDVWTKFSFLYILYLSEKFLLVINECFEVTNCSIAILYKKRFMCTACCCARGSTAGTI